MGFLSDIGHALTGTKTDAQNRTDRLQDERRIERNRAKRTERFGGDGSVRWSAQANGFVNSLGETVSDAQYDDAYGAGASRKFRDDAALTWGANQAPPPSPDIAAQTQAALDATGQTQPTQTQPTRPPPVTGFDGAITGQRGRTVTGSTGGANAWASGIDQTGLDNVFGSGGGSPKPTAPTMGTEEIDKLTGGLDTYQNALWELSQDNTGLSAAEAQLQRATELANIQAGIESDKSQRAALGQARSARNRGDRAFLEQQAIGEAGFIGQEAARTKALTEAQARGDIAELRATEEAHDRDFRFQALKEAASLGLNRSALAIDISKANLDSLTNQLNNDAAFKQLGLQLDQQKAAQVLSFTQAMAALQFQYDKMVVDDQNTTDALLMQKYGIDQQTMVALKQLKASQQINWGQVFTQMLGGAVAGGAEIGAAYVGNPARVATSDERMKTNIQEVNANAAELDELMGALGAYEYEYKEPERDGAGLRFGFMAQELEKTKLGRHMVQPDAFGVKTVAIEPLALATASGLALVSERLKALEEAVR